MVWFIPYRGYVHKLQEDGRSKHEASSSNRSHSWGGVFKLFIGRLSVQMVVTFLRVEIPYLNCFQCHLVLVKIFVVSNIGGQS